MSVRETKQRVRQALAHCHYFRQFVGVTTTDEALAKIHVDSLPAPQNGNKYTKSELVGYRNYAIIYRSDDIDIMRAAGPGTYVRSCGLVILLERGLTGEGYRSIRNQKPIYQWNDELTETAEHIVQSYDVNKPGLVELIRSSHEHHFLFNNASVKLPLWPKKEDAEGKGDHYWIDLHLTWGQQA